MSTILSNMLFTASIFILSILIVQSAPAVQNENDTLNELELKYDYTLKLAQQKVVEEKPAEKVRIWPMDTLQRILLFGFILIIILFIILFVVYIVLAIVSPDRLNMLDFRPAIDDDLDRSQNVCAILTYWWYCCFMCGINALMIMSARKIADCFLGDGEVK